MDTVLAGQDGKSPAIDQTTGQPLTIEELLRRRGLLSVGGVTRLNGQAPATPTAQTTVGDPSASAGASGVAGSNPLAAVLAARGGAPASAATLPSPNPAQPAVSNASGAVDPLSAVGNGSGMGMPNLAPLGVGAAAGLGYALARRKKAQAGINSSEFGAGGNAPRAGSPAGEGGSKPPMAMPGTTVNNNLTRQHGMIEGTRQLPGPIPEGEFNEVHPLARVLTNRNVIKALTKIP